MRGGVVSCSLFWNVQGAKGIKHCPGKEICQEGIPYIYEPILLVTHLSEQRNGVIRSRGSGNKVWELAHRETRLLGCVMR